MNDSKSFRRKAPVITLIFVVLVLVGLLTKRLASKPAPTISASPVSALTVTPQVAAGPNDLFEDVTPKAGIGFVHQYCD